MGEYQLRDYCECGWSTIPAHGNKWFSDKEYPVCPDCGADHYERKLVKGKLVKPDGWRWWHMTGWKFEPLSQPKHIEE